MHPKSVHWTFINSLLELVSLLEQVKYLASVEPDLLSFCQPSPIHSNHDHKTTQALNRAIDLPWVPTDWLTPQDHLWNARS
jgi:hypothetical protein